MQSYIWISKILDKIFPKTIEYIEMLEREKTRQEFYSVGVRLHYCGNKPSSAVILRGHQYGFWDHSKGFVGIAEKEYVK